MRDARLAHDVGLRELARELGIAPSYMADIENDRRTPTEHLLAALAPRLGLDFDQLMAQSRRIGDTAERYAREVPAAARLFMRMAALNVDELTIRRLEDEIEKGG